MGVTCLCFYELGWLLKFLMRLRKLPSMKLLFMMISRGVMMPNFTGFNSWLFSTSCPLDILGFIVLRIWRISWGVVGSKNKVWSDSLMCAWSSALKVCPCALVLTDAKCVAKASAMWSGLVMCCQQRVNSQVYQFGGQFQ